MKPRTKPVKCGLIWAGCVFISYALDQVANGQLFAEEIATFKTGDIPSIAGRIAGLMIVPAVIFLIVFLIQGWRCRRQNRRNAHENKLWIARHVT